MLGRRVRRVMYGVVGLGEGENLEYSLYDCFQLLCACVWVCQCNEVLVEILDDEIVRLCIDKINEWWDRRRTRKCT